MVVGIDIDGHDDVCSMSRIVVLLGQYGQLDEKYVRAVDAKIDVFITYDEKAAQYFRDNGIESFVVLR